jgi:hypothetical protein
MEEKQDFVTVIKGLDGGRAPFAKKFKEGEKLPPKYPVWHIGQEIGVDNLEEVYELFERLRNRRNCCVVRNRMDLQKEESSLCRRKRDGTWKFRRKRDNFKDIGHYWVMFDFDSADILDPDTWKSNPKAAAEEIILEYLPVEFHEAGYIWAYSGSHGLGKPGTSLHLVFWMETPVNNRDWGNWIDQHEDLDLDVFDKALFRPAQVHIIADPELIRTSDPFRDVARCGYVEGEQVVFDIDLSQIEPPKPKRKLTVSEDHMFSVLEQYYISPMQSTFNDFVPPDDILEYFGYEKKEERRYLCPASTTDSAGVWIEDNRIFSHHDNDPLSTGRYMTAYEAFCLLYSHRVAVMRGGNALFGGVEQLDAMLDDVEDADPTAALEAADAQQMEDSEKNPDDLAKQAACKLLMHYTLHYINQYYFTIDVEGSLLIYSMVKLEDGNSKQLVGYTRDKMKAELSKWAFRRGDFQMSNAGWLYSERKVDILEEWLAWDNRRKHRGIGLYFNEAPPKMLDLWEGFAIKPKEGQWNILYRHIHEVICGGDGFKFEYLMDMLAAWVQRPEERFGVAPVLIGSQGTGKNMFANAVARLFKKNNRMIAFDRESLFLQFNAHLANIVLFVADEFSLRSGKSADDANKLKGFITGDTMRLEIKGGALMPNVANRMHFIIITNDRKPMPLDKEERRYFILNVSTCKVGDREYFERLKNAIDDDEIIAGFLYSLMERRVDFAAQYQAMKTETFYDVVEYNDDPFTEWLISMVEDESPLPGLEVAHSHDAGFDYTELPDFGEWVPTELLYQSYCAFCDHLKRFKFSKRDIGKRLRNLGFEQQRSRAHSNAMYKGKKKHHYGYLMPDLRGLKKLFTRVADKDIDGRESLEDFIEELNNKARNKELDKFGPLEVVYDADELVSK